MTSFIFQEHYEFTWPVKVQIPVDGGFVEQVFNGRFIMASEDAIFSSGGAEDPASQVEEELGRLTEVFLGWTDGVGQEDGTPIPSTDENIRRLLKQRPVRLAVIKAWTEAVILGRVRTKN